MVDEDDLDALVRRADPDRWLASRFIGDRAKRADVVALYAYDHELARAPKVTSNALIAEIRLAWWTELIAEIYDGKTVRAHPTAVALAKAIGRRDLPRAPLDAMIDARAAVLRAGVLETQAALSWADDVAGSTAALASHILDPASPSDPARRVGRAWGLSMLRRSGADVANLDGRLQTAVAEAEARSRDVSAEAFPAIAAVTLVKCGLTGRPPSALGARVRLVLAVLRGKI